MELTSQLVYISLVLFLAFLGGLVFERLKLPKLVGYILVGTLLGPSILGLLQESESVRFLSELGITLLLFVLGIELDTSRFGGYLKKALTVALVQVVAATALMYGIGEIFGWPLELRILFGFIAALSSTAIAVSMLENLRAAQTHTAGLAVGILIAQDILVIPMLLIVSAFGAASLSVQSLTQLGLSITLIAAVLAGALYAAGRPRTLERIERILSFGAAQPVIAGLALGFGAAALTGSLGLSTAFGAFAMGVLIGNAPLGAHYRKAIEPIHDLLIMVFFLSVGLLVDVSFVFSHAVEIGLILVATIVLKTAFNYWLVRSLGEPAYRAFTVSAVLAQIGEFSFVLIAVGAASGFIDFEGYQTALSVIVLSLVISPLWLDMIRQYLLRKGIYLAGTMPDKE
jgi:CPA2 family monovalent cation:H+ antiporter-2